MACRNDNQAAARRFKRAIGAGEATSDGDAKIREDASAVFVSADGRLRFRL
jgi:hypothetical protein